MLPAGFIAVAAQVKKKIDLDCSGSLLSVAAYVKVRSYLITR